MGETKVGRYKLFQKGGRGCAPVSATTMLSGVLGKSTAPAAPAMETRSCEHLTTGTGEFSDKVTVRFGPAFGPVEERGQLVIRQKRDPAQRANTTRGVVDTFRCLWDLCFSCYVQEYRPPIDGGLKLCRTVLPRYRCGPSAGCYCLTHNNYERQHLTRIDDRRKP